MVREHIPSEACLTPQVVVMIRNQSSENTYREYRLPVCYIFSCYIHRHRHPTRILGSACPVRSEADLQDRQRGYNAPATWLEVQKVMPMKKNFLERRTFMLQFIRLSPCTSPQLKLRPTIVSPRPEESAALAKLLPVLKLDSWLA